MGKCLRLINKIFMKINPKYKKIKQMPYCCVPACISMILDRHKIKHKSQEDIGYKLGLVIPEDKVRQFKKAKTGKMPLAGYGTQIGKNRYSINNYFKNCKILLKETYYGPKDLISIKQFIEDNLKIGNDIIVCFNNEALFGSGNFGHVCLVQEINNNIITLVNPENSRDKDNVNLDNLIKAMIIHGKIRRGVFWLISKLIQFKQ